MGENLRMLCARIAEETKRRFKSRVAELGLDIQQVITDLIERWIKETDSHEPPPKPTRKRR
jgi:antitoxin component of RelBE/YafQ-DinJ toxin-antitoxin module